MRRILLAAFWSAAALLAASQDHLRCKQKIALIVEGKAAPGSRIEFSPKELNAFLNEEVVQAIPGGVQGARVEIGPGRVSGFASVNFAKLMQARGSPPGWLMTKMLDGWKPVLATARLESGGGRATVNLEKVELSGVTVPAFIVDFMLRHFGLRYSPDLKLGQPFALKHRIDRLELYPSAFAVIIRR